MLTTGADAVSATSAAASAAADSAEGDMSGAVETLYIRGVPIVSITIDGVKRLCLAQISNTLLAKYSYNEIHNRRVALGINCVQCTPVQLELLRRVGAMPTSSRRCGMITHREADRLVRSFLDSPEPPKLPKDFAFSVQHECGWGCKGLFHVARYTSSRAKCVCCATCQTFLSPNKFIFHFHRTNSNVYKHPDAANFNSWRRHLFLQDRDRDAVDLSYAWEDVKAMFNGGNRKRSLTPGSVGHDACTGAGAGSDDEGAPASAADALDSDADAAEDGDGDGDGELRDDAEPTVSGNRSSSETSTPTACRVGGKRGRLSEKADLRLTTAHPNFYKHTHTHMHTHTPTHTPQEYRNAEEFGSLFENAATQLFSFPLLPPALLSPVTPTTPDASLLLSGLFQSFYQNYQHMLAQSLQQQQQQNLNLNLNLASMLEPACSRREQPKVTLSPSRKNKDQPSDYSISKLIN